MNFPLSFLIQKKVLQPTFFTQCPEMILNKVAKTFDKIFKGLTSLIQKFQICFLKSLAVRLWNPPAKKQCQISPTQAISAIVPSMWIPCPNS